MAEPERDRWGRYKLPNPLTGETQPWTRATTLAGALDDKTGIHQWETRHVIRGLVMESSEDLRVLALGTDLDEKKQFRTIAEKAMERSQSGAASNFGTALHKFTQRRDQGQPIRGTEKFEKRVADYRRKLEAKDVAIDARYIERITVVPELGVAGTMDRLVTWRVNGKTYVGDLKTGGSVSHPHSFAIQLAIYANGHGLWNDFDACYDPMPEVDKERGIIIHLPANDMDAEPELYWVDIAAGWEMAHIAKQVRDFRSRKDLLTPFD